MDLSFDPPGIPNYIRTVTGEGVRIGEQTLALPALVTGNEIVAGWPPTSVEELEEDHLEAIKGLSPELVLMGTGSRQVFPHPRLVFALQREGIGIEVMSTDAACRTYNVLAGEGRKVVAALMPLDMP